jgi:hypothetical protein
MCRILRERSPRRVALAAFLFALAVIAFPFGPAVLEGTAERADKGDQATLSIAVTADLHARDAQSFLDQHKISVVDSCTRLSYTPTLEPNTVLKKVVAIPGRFRSITRDDRFAVFFELNEGDVLDGCSFAASRVAKDMLRSGSWYLLVGTLLGREMITLLQEPAQRSGLYLPHIRSADMQQCQVALCKDLVPVR